MASEKKLMRTVRVRNDQVSGALGQLLIAIAEAGCDVGEFHFHRADALAVARTANQQGLRRAEFIPYLED
jgi:hypothetical protein